MGRYVAFFSGMGRSLLTRSILLSMASAIALAGGVEHLQCPPGTGASLEGDNVVCRPLPAPGHKTRIVKSPEVLYPETGSPRVSPASAGALELRGLRSVPELCGLNALEDTEVEEAAEAIHIVVSECSDEVGADPALRPTRWMVFRVDALSETAHEIVSPSSESWAASMNVCLARQKLRVPKAVRGRSFTAWYLLAQTRDDRPSSPACIKR